MEMVEKKDRVIYFLYALVIFAILVAYYTIINPVAVFDTDDWYYIYELRRPIPMVGAFEPTRVFPEFLEPIVSYAGAYLVYPIVCNYCFSQTIIHGLVISFILSLYFFEFIRMIHRLFHLSTAKYLFVGIVFFGLHFIVFLHSGGNSYNLFYAYDLTCLYFYTCSIALNAALVMHLIYHGGIKAVCNNYSIIHRLVIIVWAYFAINSNLYSSIILAAYVSSELIIELYKMISCKSFSLMEYCRKNIVSLIILFCWLLSHVIEKTGGRSDIRVRDMASNIKLAFQSLFSVAASVNVFCVLFGISIIVLWVKKCKKDKERIVKLLLCFLLTLSYVFLLSLVVDGEYVGRVEIVFAYAIWILLALMGCFAEVISVSHRNALWALILLGTVFMFLGGHNNIFAPINSAGITYKQSEMIMNDIITQFKNAEETGEAEIDLVIPKFDSDDNWPFGVYAKDEFAYALYLHKVIGKPINVRSLILSEDMYKKYIDDYQSE